MQTKILHMSKNHFIRKHGFEKGYRFIVNYHLNNSELYGIPVRALQEYYDVIDSKNLPIDAKNKILAKLELDILEQTMKLIESFAAIATACKNDSSLIQAEDIIVTFNSGDATKFYEHSSRWKKRDFYELFAYSLPNTPDVSIKEKRFLKKVYSSNIREIKKFLKLVSKFREINLIAYNKSKHSMPMLIGIPASLPPDIYSFSLIFYKNKTKKIIPKFIPHSKKIVGKYTTICKTLILLMKDILWSKILYLELKGNKPIITTTYFESDPTVNSAIQKINFKLSKNLKKDNIHIPIKINLSKRVLKNKLDFLYKDLTPTIITPDKKLIEYAKEIT